MAKNIYDPAIFNDLVVRTNHPPPGQVTSSTFLSNYGYRCLRPKGANSWLLFATLGGKGLFQQPDLSFEAKPNSITLLGPTAYSDYSVPPDKNLKASQANFEIKNDVSSSMIKSKPPKLPKTPHWYFHWSHFQFNENWFRWFNMPEVGKGLFHIDNVDKTTMQRIDFLFWELREMLENENQLNDAMTQNTLERLLLLISQTRSKQEHPIDERISKTLNILHKQYQMQHSIESLANVANLSESRFAHLFKEQIGESAMQVLKRVRIKHAQELLNTTQLSLGEIASQLGYESSFYFSNQFKQVMGISPKFYRSRSSGDSLGH